MKSTTCDEDYQAQNRPGSMNKEEDKLCGVHVAGGCASPGWHFPRSFLEHDQQYLSYREHALEASWCGDCGFNWKSGPLTELTFVCQPWAEIAKKGNPRIQCFCYRLL